MEEFKTAVRPIITLLFAGAFIYLTIEKMVSADAFLGIATLVIKYWFDSREPERKAS
jgi:hypothetical protein